MFVVDAHRDDGKRLVVHADEKLTAFLELESTIRAAERPEDCGGREIKLDKLSRNQVKVSSISSSESFISSARLNKPQGAESSLRHR